LNNRAGLASSRGQDFKVPNPAECLEAAPPRAPRGPGETSTLSNSCTQGGACRHQPTDASAGSDAFAPASRRSVPHRATRWDADNGGAAGVGEQSVREDVCMLYSRQPTNWSRLRPSCLWLRFCASRYRPRTIVCLGFSVLIFCWAFSHAFAEVGQGCQEVSQHRASSRRRTSGRTKCAARSAATDPTKVPRSAPRRGKPAPERRARRRVHKLEAVGL
jgi:hypothetical protein